VVIAYTIITILMLLAFSFILGDVGVYGIALDALLNGRPAQASTVDRKPTFQVLPSPVYSVIKLFFILTFFTFLFRIILPKDGSVSRNS
jgi:hypothetical protein